MSKSIMSNHPIIVRRAAVLRAIKEEGPKAPLKVLIARCEAYGVPMWQKSIRRFAFGLEEKGYVKIETAPYRYTILAPGKKELARLDGEIKLLPASATKPKSRPKLRGLARAKPAKESAPVQAKVIENRDEFAEIEEDALRQGLSAASISVDSEIFKAALALKQEVFDGLRMPKLAMSDLEEAAREFGIDSTFAWDLWHRVWWYGIPGMAQVVDRELLGKVEWTIFQGRERAAALHDGEGRILKSLKWYFSPPNYPLVYSAAHDSQKEAETAAAAVVRRLQVSIPGEKAREPRKARGRAKSQTRGRAKSQTRGRVKGREMATATRRVHCIADSRS